MQNAWNSKSKIHHHRSIPEALPEYHKMEHTHWMAINPWLVYNCSNPKFLGPNHVELELDYVCRRSKWFHNKKNARNIPPPIPAALKHISRPMEERTRAQRTCNRSTYPYYDILSYQVPGTGTNCYHSAWKVENRNSSNMYVDLTVDVHTLVLRNTRTTYFICTYFICNCNTSRST